MLSLLAAAVLTWIPPTFNVDGTQLIDLASYDVWYGCSQSGVYTDVETLPAPANTHTIEGLSGTCYFAVKAINSKGESSAFSTETNRSFVEFPGTVTNIQIAWRESVMALPATEDFATANDPLTTSANWSQPGATSDSGKAAAGVYDDAIDSSDKSAYWASDSFANDQYAQITMVSSNTGANERLGVILRGGSGNEAFLIRFRTTTATRDFECYYWNSSGTRIQIGTAYTPSEAFNNGDTMRLEIVGTTITLKLDFGSGFVTETTFDGSSGPSSGAAGVYIVSGTGNTTGDDWEGGDLAAGGVGNPWYYYANQ